MLRAILGAQDTDLRRHTHSIAPPNARVVAPHVAGIDGATRHPLWTEPHAAWLDEPHAAWFGRSHTPPGLDEERMFK
jgi:hypothetical protein